MVMAEVQKRRAVEQHSLQAGQFTEWYRQLEADPYWDCFTYSRRRLQVLLGRYLPASGYGLRLLDVGCGTGHHLAELRRRGFEAAGVDGSATMLEHARARNPGADVRHADVERLPFPDGGFDYVLCIEVLRYLPDPSGCIREMCRVLRPGGICLATATPLLNLNAYWLVNRLALVLPLGNLARLKQYFATSGKLQRRFVAAGFAAPTVHGVYTGPINWVQRLAPRVLPRFLKAWEPLDAVLADRGPLRELSNMFLIRAVRRS
jgi:ubiquinone/menaquinone biosynthesis C-methylase UbiE